MDKIPGKDKCAIFHIPCVCLTHTNQMDKNWVPFTPDDDKSRHTCIDSCIYAPIIGSFNDWIILKFDN